MSKSRVKPVIAIILSRQLAAIQRVGIFFTVPRLNSFNSIIIGTTTAGDTPVTKNLFIIGCHYFLFWHDN